MYRNMVADKSERAQGLALQLVVRPDDIPGVNGPLDGVKQICKAWDKHTETDPLFQTDSGI